MVTITNILDIRNQQTATLLVNKTGHAAPKTVDVLKISEMHAIDNYGCVYQMLNEVPEGATLVYVNDGIYYNYAEDELDIEQVHDFILRLDPSFDEMSENDFGDDEVKGEIAYDNDDVCHSYNEIINALESEIGYVSDYAKLMWLFGIRRRFNDDGTRFNPDTNYPDYNPHTYYYFL